MSLTGAKNCETIKNSSILIVDDNPENLQILGSILESKKYVVSAAQNGPTAIAYAKDKKPSLIMLDLMMPGMSGFDVCDSLKNDALTKDIPIICITGITDAYNKIKAFESGAVDYIIKPFDPNEVLQRVSLHIENQNLNQELTRLNTELSNANDLKNEFLGMVIHDLRTPVASFNACSEILLSEECGSINDEQNLMIEMIHNNSTYLLGIIENIMDIGSIEAGTLTLNPQPNNLKLLIESRLPIFTPIARNKSIRLLCDLDDVEFINFDRQRLTQIIDNLISNAIKYSNPNSKVFLKLIEDVSTQIFSVIDEGPGLTKKDQEFIFKAYHRGSATPTADEPNFCIGLAVAQRIAHAHHGGITVMNNQDQGATFTFSLPKNSLLED